MRVFAVKHLATVAERDAATVHVYGVVTETTENNHVITGHCIRGGVDYIVTVLGVHHKLTVAAVAMLEAYRDNSNTIGKRESAFHGKVTRFKFRHFAALGRAVAQRGIYVNLFRLAKGTLCFGKRLSASGKRIVVCRATVIGCVRKNGRCTRCNFSCRFLGIAVYVHGIVSSVSASNARTRIHHGECLESILAVDSLVHIYRVGTRTQVVFGIFHLGGSDTAFANIVMLKADGMFVKIHNRSFGILDILFN